MAPRMTQWLQAQHWDRVRRAWRGTGYDVLDNRHRRAEAERLPGEQRPELGTPGDLRMARSQRAWRVFTSQLRYRLKIILYF